MTSATLLLPAAMAGYLVADLERFLAAADERSRALEAAIAAARIRLEVALEAEASSRDFRRDIAREWLAAQQAADAIRADADAWAAAVVEGAEQEARGIRARAALEHRGSRPDVEDPR